MNKNIGIIGDGQLAKMLIESGIPYNLKFYVYPLGPVEDSICKDIATLVFSYDELFKLSDIVTYEFEGIDTNNFKKYDTGSNIIPKLDVLEMIQSKVAQKQFYLKHNLPSSLLYSIQDGQNMLEYIKQCIKEDDTQLNNWVLKSDKGGYNGKGVLCLHNKLPLETIVEFLNPNETYLLEKKINIKKELAVMVIYQDECVQYDIVEMVFTDDNILKYQFSPANITKLLYRKITELIENLMEFVNSSGLFGIELFLDDEDNIYINEMSPRPHNSGHHTIKNSYQSQFEVLIRVLANIPRNIYDNHMDEKNSMMINLLGPNFTGPYKLDINVYSELEQDGFSIYDYGKKINKPNRKMGHMTYVSDVKLDQKKVEDLYKQIMEYKLIIPDYDTPYNSRHVDVGVIMGSISDKPIVDTAITILEQLNVSYEYNIISAHRMPNEMMEYAKSAVKRGLKVIIACAGGAAHLPGMVASMTTLPVIGLPVKTSTLDGLDSLYSIVQMPRGIPVATVAINNGTNAALLACRILSIQDATLKINLDSYHKGMNQKAIESNKAISSHKLDKDA